MRSAKNRLDRRWLGGLAAGFWLGCAGSLPAPAAAPRSVLLCDTGLDDALVTVLAAPGRLIQRVQPGQAAECQNGALAATSVGGPCLHEQQACQTPMYVDGKLIGVADSPYDAVLLPDDVARRAGTHKVVEMESGSGSAGPGGQGGGQGRGGRGGGGQGRVGGNGKKVERMVGSSDDGWSGKVFVFAPRSGQIQAGREFTNVSPNSFKSIIDRLLEQGNGQAR